MPNKFTIFENSIYFSTKNNYQISFKDNYWILDKERNINLSSVINKISPPLIYGYKKTLQFYAINHSSYHTTNVHNALLHFLTRTKTHKISPESLINFKSSLNRETEFILGVLKGFLKKWHGLGYEGVSEEVVILLNNWRIKGNIKGDVVKRLDPEKGPLTDIELQAFNSGALQCYEQNKITLTELALSLLISNTGRRSLQISHMKLKDLLTIYNSDQETIYFLNIPRIKQRDGYFRDAFNQIHVTKELWLILKSQADHVIDDFQTRLKNNLIPQNLISKLPLFPNKTKLKDIKNLRQLHELSEGDFLHIVANNATKAMRKIVEHANIFSERTGQLLHISSSRFRYTIGTRAAREGFGPLIIAELLDHSDTQNAHVYIENIPEYASRINEKIGHLMEPYSKAFKGQLITSENEAKRGNEITSRIRINTTENIGNCGSYDFCGGKVPIPCYTCLYFQPWLDAPHEKVLLRLLKERDQIIKDTKDLAIASANDRTILAVMEVVQLCRLRRKGISDE